MCMRGGLCCVFGITDEPLEDGGQDEQQAEATAQKREGARDRLRGETRRQGGQQVEAKRPYARNETDVLSAQRDITKPFHIGRTPVIRVGSCLHAARGAHVFDRGCIGGTRCHFVVVAVEAGTPRSKQREPQRSLCRSGRRCADSPLRLQAKQCGATCVIGFPLVFGVSGECTPENTRTLPCLCLFLLTAAPVCRYFR